MIDTDRYGYYKIGELKVYSKIEALELAEKINQQISWHYNDEIFGAQNWTKEPDVGLEELYQSRARQIRKNYDYVVIFYSGGADSHNMLESFLHAGVKIDEIVSFHSLAADGDKNSSFNREIFETAVPFVDNLRKQNRLLSHTKHRLIDMSEIISRFVNEINWLDFPYMISSTVSINNVSRAYLRRYIEEWADIIHKGRKLVLVWGHDKPRVMSEGNRFYLNFMDIFDNCVSTAIQQSYIPGWFDEMFYSTPDMPEVVIKQAHVIKNFLQQCDESHTWVTEKVTGLGHAIKHSPDGLWKSIWLSQDAQSMLIYPWFRPDLYYESKPLDIIYSKRDKWFWKDRKISTQYHKIIDGLISRFGSHWLNENPSLGTRNTRNFRSQKYWLN